MLHIIMTQYSPNTGLRYFKEQVEAEVMKELTQLGVLETFPPVEKTKITKKEIRVVDVTNFTKIKSQWIHIGACMYRR